MNRIHIIIFATCITAMGCSKKAGENLERDMGEFETKWAGLQNQGSVWNKELGDEVTACITINKNAEATIKTIEGLPEEKLKCNLYADTCARDQELLQQLWKEWKDTDSLWNGDSIEWANWKREWNNGKLKIDLARKDLAGWNNKHKDYIARLNDWKTEFETIKPVIHRHQRNMRRNCGLAGI